MALNGVTSLEELAFQVSYKEILSNLILCHNHRPKGKRLNWLPYSSLLLKNPQMSSEQVRDYVRRHLDYYLVGTMGDKIRKQYVETFNQSVFKYNEKSGDSGSSDDEDDRECSEECLVDIWVFLDCVLDGSFEELVTHVAFPGAEPNRKLIPTIAEHSPLLKKLKLNFKFVKAAANVERFKSVIHSLTSLEHLTDLSLKDVNENLRPTLLGLVGETCPLLTRLVVTSPGGSFKKEELLAIFIGEIAFDMIPKSAEEPELKPIWLQNAQLARLEIPRSVLNPICFTLKELRLHSSGHLSASAGAFILRHLPLLQELFIPGTFTSMAVKVLHDQFELQFQEKFETDFKAAVERRSKGPPQAVLQRSLNSVFSGLLSLTTIDDVDVRNRETLRAIGSLCPSLNKATFVSGSSSLDEHLGPKESWVSPNELLSILKEWPKLVAVSIEDCKSEYVTPILKVFGSDLVKIALSFGSELVFQDLALCPKVENLRLSSWDATFQLLDSGDKDLLDPTTFLSQLKVFRSSSCLGKWSQLFESKSSYVSLSLRCCHIGCLEDHIGLSDPPRKRFKSASEASVYQNEWSRIPQMWPELKELTIEAACAGLTTSMVASMIPQLPKLEKISLPHQVIQSDDLDFSHSVRAQLSVRQPPIQLQFFDDSDYEDDCDYVNEYYKKQKKQ